MSLEQDVYQILSTDEDIIALVGDDVFTNRITPVSTVSQSDTPAIVFAQTGINEIVRDMDKEVMWESVELTVELKGFDEITLVELEVLVTHALEHQSNGAWEYFFQQKSQTINADETYETSLIFSAIAN